MVDAGIERRDAARYCALPTTLHGHDVLLQIREAFQALDTYLGERDLEDRGPSIIRYRQVAEGGPLAVEIGWLMEDLAEIDPPFVVSTLPAGDYVVGWHNGPYARIAETTRGVIAWGDGEGVAWDIESNAAGDRWGSWFELYLTEPAFGPEGPTGSVEVCLRIRDEPRVELRSG
jgi:hypothetical protein